VRFLLSLPPVSSNPALQPRPRDESAHLSDENTKLALVRTIVALDRTLMAWIRTSTSLVSFGFTIYKFFQTLREEEGLPRSHHLLDPRRVALVLIGLGVGALVLATIEYRGQLKALLADFHGYSPIRHSIALAVAMTISGFGVLALVLVLLRQ
jgi:putative membrane protein